MRKPLVAAIVAALLSPAAADAAKPRTADPLVIAHRGASGYRPEHTLAAYELGARMGADFVEPDLVATKDRVLVARHENEISGTTDVADRPEFAGRRTTKTIDGVTHTGWFTEDFTLAELRTLRAKERIPELRPQNTLYDGRFLVPTFDEVAALAKRFGVGLYPEIKHPSYFRSIGIDLEALLLEALERNKLNKEHADVYVQAFEEAPLRRLAPRLRVPVVQLLPAYGSSPSIATIAQYADGAGPSKSIATEAFIDAAHARGLQVHPYTFRNEAAFTADPIAEYRKFYARGVDGVFSDNPDTAIEVRENG